MHGDVLRADASLTEEKQRLEDLRAKIDQEVRDAYLDLEAAAQEVSVEKSAVTLATQTLEQSRDRFNSGVTDDVEVVQAQDALAIANDAYIASLYSYNLAKISLARAAGVAESRYCGVFEGELSMSEQNQATNPHQATPSAQNEASGQCRRSRPADFALSEETLLQALDNSRRRSLYSPSGVHSSGTISPASNPPTMRR